LQLHDLYDLGGQFFIWELAIAIASQRLGINPFDQPNVEAAKVLAREKVDEYERNGELPLDRIDVSGDGIDIYLSNGRKSTGPGEAIREFLSEHNGRGYVTVQAYIHSTPDVDTALLDLRKKLLESTKLATTVGYGPRFLHSTGQLHKGDAGKGLFVQITADDSEDIPIPVEAGQDSSVISFGVLKTAQAQGDREALLNVDRKVIRIHLGQDVLGGLDKVVGWIS
jgi:glucose-6-phosphate isomerase/transaldolase/glucose-6-phosphate isomerase